MISTVEEDKKLIIIKSNGTARVDNGGVKRRRRRRRSSPAVLMEASRCSRVNGRGWRCCQQTLVGYSLCEHHLGKGRLRSVKYCNNGDHARNNNGRDVVHKSRRNNIFGNVVLMKGLKKTEKSSTPTSEEEGEEEVQRLLGSRRRRKIGIVKARSISSLLDETDNRPATGSGRD